MTTKKPGTEVLFVRLPADLLRRIRALSSETGLSMTKTAEILIIRGLGRPTIPTGEGKLNALLDGPETVTP